MRSATVVPPRFGVIPLGVEPPEDLARGERVRPDDRLTGQAQRADRARPFERGVGFGHPLIDDGLLRGELLEQRVERRALLLEVGLLRAQAVGRGRELLARLDEAVHRRLITLGRDVAEVLTPVLGLGLRDVQVGHRAVGVARHVDGDRTRLHLDFQRVTLRRELDALLLDRGHLGLVVGDLAHDVVVLLLGGFELLVRGVRRRLRGLQIGAGLHDSGVRVDETLLGPRRKRGPNQSHRECCCDEQPPTERARPFASTPHQRDSVGNSSNTGNTSNAGQAAARCCRSARVRDAGGGPVARPGRAPPRSRCRRPRRAPRSGPSPRLRRRRSPRRPGCRPRRGPGSAGSSAGCRRPRSWSAATARASSTSSWTATGSPTTMRGVGRPAASAAARMRGATCSAIARAFAIQRMVPSARSPATRNSLGASAETSSGTGIAGGGVAPRCA